MSMTNQLSIVIIGRNEAARIGECVEAARRAADQIGGAEILFVDSHSTDDTVDIVKTLGARVMALDASLRLAPSAGRFWGSKNVNGKYILFLDADTRVDRDFLPAAIARLEADDSCAGVNGYIDDLNEAGEKLLYIEERSAEVADVKWLRGPACLYRREAIMQVGSFNPELASEEEAELGLRLVKAGWKLEIIPVFMAVHTRCYHPHNIESVISTFRRDIRSKRLGETTRTIACSFMAGNGLAFCWLRLKTTILFVAWGMLLCSLSLLPQQFYPRAAVATAFVAGLLMIYRKKRNLSETLLFVPSKLISLVDIGVGIFYAFSHVASHRSKRSA